MSPFVFDEKAAALNTDVAGPKDLTHAGDCREKGAQVACLAYARRQWVVVWVWYPESGNWSQGTKSYAWWNEAKPCAMPEGAPSPLEAKRG